MLQIPIPLQVVQLVNTACWLTEMMAMPQLSEILLSHTSRMVILAGLIRSSLEVNNTAGLKDTLTLNITVTAVDDPPAIQSTRCH